MRKVIFMITILLFASHLMGQEQYKALCKPNESENTTTISWCKACSYKPEPYRPKDHPERQFFMGDDDFTFITPCEAADGIRVFFESCDGTPYEDAIPAALNEYNNTPIAINFIIVTEQNEADLIIECVNGGCCGCANAAFPDPNNPGDGPPNGQTFFPSGGSIGSGIRLDINAPTCICAEAQMNQCFFMHTVMHEIAHTLGFYHNDGVGVDPIHVQGTPMGFDAGSIINSGPGEQAIGNFCTAACQFNQNDILALQTLYPISPMLNTQNVVVSCPAALSFDLSTLQMGNLPPNSTLIWSTDSNPDYGLDPLISTIITVSGNYFAYYYFENGNCFTDPASVQVTFRNCCDIEPDNVITNNTFVTGNNFYAGNLIVENGATLHIHLSNVLFAHNKGIIVKNGSRLILQGSTIDASCNTALFWSGIKIESGGFFDTDETFLKNVANGVDANANSTLQIYKLNIDGKGNTSGIGLKLDGNVNTDFIYNLDIKDFNVGIQTFSSNIVHEFNHGSINNTSFGISAVSSPIIVNDYDINFANDAITLTLSAGSSIFDCDIIYKQQGIAIAISPFTKVENCSVSNNNWIYGIENLNERPAIGLVLSDGCTIQNNFSIASAANAVSAWGSNNATIDNNSISTNFSLNGQLTGGPVNLQFGNGHTVTNNHIGADQSEFGINSTWAGGTTIMNNTIYNSGFQKNFRTAAIKATGNLDEDILRNIVSGDRRTGVLVQNTTGNDYVCNELNSTYDEAQNILYNSEQQIIKANTFDGGTSFDLKIRSEIGTQATVNSNNIPIENWGNVFLGGNAEADPQVYENSQFPYNTMYGTSLNHRPSNPNPSNGWFTSNNVTTYANCEGLVMGDNFIFGNDPNKICALWNYLKSIRTTKPELFFVKLVHLLKYSKMKAGFILPNCIKFDLVFTTLCGVTKIVDISVALAKVSESNVNTNTIQSLQDQYKNESSDAGKKAIKEQMATEISMIKPLLDSERNVDSLRLDSLKNELNTINCNSIIVNKWKEILKIYINFIRQGGVQNNDRSALESYSTDCSDLYGEAIHLARSMANTYNRTYYDVNDGCLENAEPRATTPQQAVDISIAPNPTTGKLNISFTGEFTGTITVYNSSGQKVLAQKLFKSFADEIDISNEAPGLYLMQVVPDQGTTKEFKVILIK